LINRIEDNKKNKLERLARLRQARGDGAVDEA
jgi:hypothetical protein